MSFLHGLWEWAKNRWQRVKRVVRRTVEKVVGFAKIVYRSVKQVVVKLAVRIGKFLLKHIKGWETIRDAALKFCRAKGYSKAVKIIVMLDHVVSAATRWVKLKYYAKNGGERARSIGVAKIKKSDYVESGANYKKGVRYDVTDAMRLNS